MSNNRLMIGKVAEQTGLKVETIRFYQKEGLVPEPGRTEVDIGYMHRTM